MKFITPKLHAIIDFILVLFLVAAPTIFSFTGILADFTYALATIHLILTLVTNSSGGVIKLMPFTMHGLIELIVGPILIVLAFTLFDDSEAGKLFYACFGAGVLIICLFTDYKDPKIYLESTLKARSKQAV